MSVRIIVYGNAVATFTGEDCLRRATAYARLFEKLTGEKPKLEVEVT